MRQYYANLNKDYYYYYYYYYFYYYYYSYHYLRDSLYGENNDNRGNNLQAMIGAFMTV